MIRPRSATPEKLSSSKRRKLRRDAVHRHVSAQGILKQLRPTDVVPISKQEFLKRRIYASEIRTICLDELRPQPKSVHGGATEVQYLSLNGDPRLFLPPPIPSITLRAQLHVESAFQVHSRMDDTEAWKILECKAMECEDLRASLMRCQLPLRWENGEPLAKKPFQFNIGAEVFGPGNTQCVLVDAPVPTCMKCSSRDCVCMQRDDDCSEPAIEMTENSEEERKPTTPADVHGMSQYFEDVDFCRELIISFWEDFWDRGKQGHNQSVFD